MPDYSSRLLIEELDQSRQPQRVLELVGPALPFQGAAWGGEMRMETTWYQGNPDEATQQALVPMDVPSAWNGEWNLTRMNRAPSTLRDASGAPSELVSPGVLADTIEDIFRRGRLLRVSWVVESDVPGLSRRIVREGRAKQWNFQYRTSVDITWSITYEWKGRGTPMQKVTSTRDENIPSAVANLKASIQQTITLMKIKAVSANPLKPKSATNFTLGQLEAFAKAPLAMVKNLESNLNRVVSTFDQVADLVDTTRNLPFAIANSALDFSRNTVALANQFVDTMGRQPFEKQNTKTKAADLLRSATYFGKVADSHDNILRNSLSLDAQTRSQIATSPTLRGAASVKQTSATRPGSIIAIVATKQGDTPESLALRYYKDADGAVDIMRANHLPWYQPTFKPGTILIIPVRETSKAI